jgi:hypothetical protein
VWSNQSFAAWRWTCDNASSGFSGSSMMMKMSAAAPGQHATDRGGEPAALRRGLEFGHRVPLRRKAG